ncbi:DUF445 domain-containing protein [Comamonas sp.]|uniref:DUF445 domain-containing protein n=1 Tax=Comamonas sp. TaxID=34028 RepID=UPI00289FEDF1|nr:DUF445 domain-containing protein [Comamonas sp.]
MPLLLTDAQQRLLRRAKLTPFLLLLAVACMFVLASWCLGQPFAQSHHWQLALRCLRAMTEAGMVGALADWFAVAALFKHIPIPWISRHTAIIPRNKDRIGENLAVFVRERFLDGDSLVQLVRTHQPADKLAQWLKAPANAELLGHQVARLAAAALATVQDAQVERFIKLALRTLLGQIDLSQSLSKVLTVLTHNGRHQVLLAQALDKLVELLHEAETRTLIAQTIAHWLKTEHPLKEKMLPTGWLSDKGSAMIASSLEHLLDAIADNPSHVLRAKFDQTMQEWVERLAQDPAWHAKGEEVRRYLQHDPAVGEYVQELWQSLRASLQADLANEHSAMARNVRGMGLWLGKSLAADQALRSSLNTRMELWVQELAPEISQFFGTHIADTVKRWDARELGELIEWNIGRDLQYIRINGTLVGGLIGFALFWLGWLVNHLGGGSA